MISQKIRINFKKKSASWLISVLVISYFSGHRLCCVLPLHSLAPVTNLIQSCSWGVHGFKGEGEVEQQKTQVF